MKRALAVAGWVLLAFALLVYLRNPYREIHGQDFFYYQSLARLSRVAPGAAFYASGDRLREIEATALASRLRSELGWAIDPPQAFALAVSLPDPRRVSGPLPARYYPEWSSLKEQSRSEYSKVAPPTVALLRLLRLDTLPFPKAYWLWSLLSLACLLLGCLALFQSFPLRGIPWVLGAGIALLFAPCLTSFAFGQFMELLFLCVAGFFALRARRPLLAGALLGCSLALKPLTLGLVLAIAWLAVFGAARRRTLRELAGVALGGLATALVGELVLGAGAWLAWFRGFPLWYAGYEYTLFSPANRSFAAALISWLQLRRFTPLVQHAQTSYAALVALWYVVVFLAPSTRRRLAAHPQAALCLGLVSPLVVSRFVLAQYEVLLLIPLALLAGNALATANPRERHGRLLLAGFLWLGFSLYDYAYVLLVAHVEVFLFPVLLLALLAITRQETMRQP